MLLRRHERNRQTEEPVEVEEVKVDEPQTEEPVEVEVPKRSRSKK